MSEKRCLGCMRLKQNSPVCEHCGHDERTPNAPHQLPPGTVLNNQYVVGRVLGQGGFGITYMGWDQFLGIPVAIKEFYPSGIVTRDTTKSASLFLYSSQATDRFVNNRDRFVREATSLARLGRSSGAANIVSVHNLVQANHTAYIIMEYVDGIDLRKYMKQQGGVLTLAETLRLLLPVMESLEKVHESHIVHRDISPDNIMVMPDGSTKLIDFGAAHEVQQDEEGNQKSTEAILKYGFAPPEQYQRKGELGPWTDVYALCATIYYCTTGKLPPNATDRVLGDEDFEWENVPCLSGSMARALQKGTAIRKDDRIQSMAQLREALTAKEPEQPDDRRRETEQNHFGTVALEEEKPRPLGVDSHRTGENPVFTAPVTPQEAAKITAATRGGVPESAPVQKQENTQKKKPSGGYKKGLLAIAIVAVLVLGWLVLKPKPEPLPEDFLSNAESTVDPDAWKDNVLMRTYGEEERTDLSEYKDLTVYRSDIPNDQILSVTFLDTLAEEPSDSWDVSREEDGSVKAWAKPNGELYDLYIAAEGGINGEVACEKMFLYFSNLKTIQFNGAFHTQQATSMDYMFSTCENLTELDVSVFDTSSVTNMEYMFVNCKTLTTLDLSSFDTSNVTDMGVMFEECENLTALDISAFDTAKVTNMKRMFWGCSVLDQLDLSHFDTSNVIYMNNMFYNCSGLTALNVSSFDTSNVTRMDYLFHGCKNLTSLDVSSFDTSNVTEMSGMFDGCISLNRLDVSKFDTSRVTNMQYMFKKCTNLSELDVSGFETAKVTSMEGMFSGCSSLTKLDLRNFDTSNVKSTMYIFSGCSNLSTVNNPRLNSLLGYD